VTSPCNIVEAIALKRYALQLRFDDGTEQVIDFEPFLSQSRHPQIRTYLDLAKFHQFRLEHGELVWGDYELCFPVIDLHSGRIDHGTVLAAAA